MTICFSGNVPKEITISEVCIDHSKANHILFSIDNINRKGDGRTIKTEQFNQQEIDAKSAILLGYHFQSYWPKSPSNTHQLTACTSNAIWSQTTCIFWPSFKIRREILCHLNIDGAKTISSLFFARIYLLVIRGKCITPCSYNRCLPMVLSNEPTRTSIEIQPSLPSLSYSDPIKSC